MSKAHQILNYPGLPEVSGADLVAGYKKQLAGLGIEVTEKRVNAVYAMGDYFGIQASGEILEASTVILAAGIVMGNRSREKTSCLEAASATARPVMRSSSAERKLR